MTLLCEEYILTHSVQETLEILTHACGQARLVGGGTDLLLEISQGRHLPVRVLVDVSEIEEMCSLEIRDGSLFIGASVTLSRLADSSLIIEHGQALTDATLLMANPQVCNVATIGGNVAHALPAADGSIALLALDAHAEVADLKGRRQVPLQALFKGPGESSLDPKSSLIVGFYLPLRDNGQASAFVRRVNPQGIALAMLNMAIWLERTGDRVANIRIALGPSGPIPSRITSTEEVFLNQTLCAEVSAHALEVLLKEVHFRTSPHRATAEYRHHLAGILLDEALDLAWQRAGSC